MKKLFKTGFAILAVMALSITSCSDDDNQTNNNNNNGGLPDGTFLQGKVNGADFSASIMGQSTAIATRQGTGAGTLITVQGAAMDTNAMVIAMMGITETGTYTIDSEDDGSVMAYVSSNVSYDTSNCSGATGTLNITYIDNTKVEGTFNFVGKDDENCSNSKTITEGSFRGVFAN